VRAWVRDVGGVLVAWAFVVVAEFVVIGITCRGLFAGNWELLLARKTVGSVALAMLVPAAFVVVAVGRLAARSADDPRARRALALLGVMVAGLVGVGVTEGRHFESFAVRGPFVALLDAAAFALVYLAAPRLARLLGGPLGKPASLVLAFASAALFWLADAHLLPRLYPAFHSFLLGGLLASAALSVIAWRTPATGPVPRSELALGVIGLGLGVAALAWSPIGSRRLARSDNLRFVLAEHAPILGRAVQVAAWIAPPAPLDDDLAAAAAPAVGEVPRALDWSGEDILLVSVDALRADHLGAYGYARATTPNLDALAAQGARFEHAYCPTPHTSYSVTSMMTGKAMRPLLSLGLGKESDTWATYLRRYGYKTAAFYPPAVFYIDAERFTDFEKSGLGFEYRWVEFTTAEEKVHEVERYLAKVGPEPVFLWVHLFEPHEPYVKHEGHTFGGEASLPVDAYDSEVAYADAAIGALLKVVRAKRPKTTVIVTADHGEEFGEHGGRYHGTTCYEEQVRVPLIVAGPGVAPRQVSTVVQTIDLLPTVLSALGIPRPARVRGRDLGEVLAGAANRPNDPGLAYAETDDQTLLARGDDRLLCARKVAACALYDLKADPGERVDVASQHPAVARELRALTAGIERDQGRYEAASVVWPEALRRGMQGEADAAEDVAALLDDANVVIRRQAAQVTFRLAVAAVLPQVKRALARDEDEAVKRWAALALVRIGEAPADVANPKAEALVQDADVKWRRAAALAFALRGDPRGKGELATWWHDEAPPRPGLDTADAKELLTALARIRDSEAVPALLTSLEYVPTRPRLAATLGDIGDPRARPPLLALFATERYETARPFEARALLALGAGKDLLAPLAVFAGLVDPMTDAITLAHEGKLLDAKHGGVDFAEPKADVEARVSVPGASGPRRLWVLAAGEGGVLTGDVDGVPLKSVTTTGAVHAVEFVGGDDVALRLHEDTGLVAVWVVPALHDVPAALRPPVPDAGDGGR
jgi:arylsulfatase A-like enzyme